MPIPEYPESTPPDSRWCWYMEMPASWEGVDPTVLTGRIMAVLAGNNVSWHGERPDVGVGSYAGIPAIWFNSDNDPSALFDGMTEPPPTDAETTTADAQARIIAFRDGLYTGDPIEVLRDLVATLYPPGTG